MTVPCVDNGVTVYIRKFTKRELEVLDLIAQGKSNKAIGRELFLSESTIKAHIRRMMNLCYIHDRAGLIGFAFRTEQML